MQKRLQKEQKQSLYTDAVLPYVNIHTTTENTILYLLHDSNNYIMLFKNGQLEQLPKYYLESCFFLKYSDIVFKIDEKRNTFLKGTTLSITVTINVLCTEPKISVSLELSMGMCSKQEIKYSTRNTHAHHASRQMYTMYM